MAVCQGASSSSLLKADQSIKHSRRTTSSVCMYCPEAIDFNTEEGLHRHCLQKLLRSLAYHPFRLDLYRNPYRVSAGEGQKKLSRGRKKDLTRKYAKHMPRPLSEASKRFTSGHRRPRQCICAASTEHKKTPMDDESIDAEKRADEITGWLNGLDVRVAASICRAYTKKKLR